jgi:hypothetical protein
MNVEEIAKLLEEVSDGENSPIKTLQILLSSIQTGK